MKKIGQNFGWVIKGNEWGFELDIGSNNIRMPVVSGDYHRTMFYSSPRRSDLSLFNPFL